jgi:hypothetical protein
MMFALSLKLSSSLKLCWTLVIFYHIFAFDHSFRQSLSFKNRAQYLKRGAQDISLWQVQLDRSTIAYIERAKIQYNDISIQQNSESESSRTSYVRFLLCCSSQICYLKFFVSFQKIIDEHGKSSINDKMMLPKLTTSELESLANGNRIQKQSRNGLSGSGLVVLDVNADVDTVFNELKNFHR